MSAKKRYRTAFCCGYKAVPHGDHVDYLVNGHCDDHGKLEVA